jgi:hypothetical protein
MQFFGALNFMPAYSRGIDLLRLLEIAEDLVQNLEWEIENTARALKPL